VCRWNPALSGLLLLLRSYVDIRLGDAPGWNPLVAAIISPDLTRARTVFADVFSSVRLGVVFPLFYFWLMVLAWMLVRKRILAMIVVFPVVLLTQGGAITHWLDWVFNAIIALVLMVVFERLGLFVAMVYLAALTVIAHDLVTSDLTAWYGLSSMITVVLLSVTALVAFRLSLGGRDLFEIKG
jgi:hypothetical protein